MHCYFLPRHHGDFFYGKYDLFWDKYDVNLEIVSCQVLLYQPLHVHEDPENNWRVPFKIQFYAHFSLVSLSVHPRSRGGAERIRQGEGRWSRPPKTALERSDLTEKFQYRESHTEAKTKKKPDQIPVPSKTIVIIYIYIYICM